MRARCMIRWHELLTPDAWPNPQSSKPIRSSGSRLFLSNNLCSCWWLAFVYNEHLSLISYAHMFTQSRSHSSRNTLAPGKKGWALLSERIFKSDSGQNDLNLRPLACSRLTSVRKIMSTRLARHSTLNAMILERTLRNRLYLDFELRARIATFCCAVHKSLLESSRLFFNS